MNAVTKEMTPDPFFDIEVPHIATVYKLKVTYPGYETAIVDVDLTDMAKRELYRDLPDIFLKKSPIKLDEVVVTATKVKFYNKGDTLVYNADAFQLAEGSMLDHLISQLPGVEIKENGQIYVNGKFVESLLLNGRDFFGKNNQLLLENLGAYTVKNIAVYDRDNEMAKRMGASEDKRKELVMDVNLKKEYEQSWLANIELGAGTSDRYMGRLFDLRYTNHSQIGLFGNVNNLNDRQKPGQSTTWAQENRLTGERDEAQFGLDYSFELLGSKLKPEGTLLFSHSSTDEISTVNKANLLTGGNTYEYTYNTNKNHNTRLYEYNALTFDSKYHYFYLTHKIDYRKKSGNSTVAAATFDNEYQNMNRGIIEDIYTSGSAEEKESLLNRSLQNYKTNSDLWDVTVDLTHVPTIKGTNDHMFNILAYSFKSEKGKTFKDYQINYGQNSVPAASNNEYYRNSPNRQYDILARTEYQLTFPTGQIRPGYRFYHMEKDKDAYRYQLDKLEDLGIFGTLPDGYESTMDFSNSYSSHYIQNKHIVNLIIENEFFKKKLFIYIMPWITHVREKMAYTRGVTRYDIKNTNTFFTAHNTIEAKLGEYNYNGSTQYRHILKGNYHITEKLPDLMYMAPVTDATDPLNIYMGANDLDVEIDHKLSLSWQLVPRGRAMNMATIFGYNIQDNALVRGYTYDTNTGVRTIRSYNVDNCWQRYLSNSINWMIGKRKLLTFSATSRIENGHSSDMIGIDETTPTQSTVSNWILSENLKLNYKLGKQSITFKGDVIWRNTTSTLEGFNSFHATTLNYGVLGTFVLPWHFGLSTDFTLYTRRGYSDSRLNTTDAVWNARLTYSFGKGRWVAMLDGYDMLHQLSNVTYAVTAQARTISFTNTLPRYMMLHLQYKFNFTKAKGK